MSVAAGAALLAVQDVAPGGLVCPLEHGVHETTSVVALYVFAAQSVQTRSAVANPAVLTYFPAAQLVHVVHLD
jgi:hypothetical protein